MKCQPESLGMFGAIRGKIGKDNELKKPENRQFKNEKFMRQTQTDLLDPQI